MGPPTGHWPGSTTSAFRRSWASYAQPTSGLVPPVEINKDGEDVVLTVELPGVDVAKDVNVEVDGRRLIVSGERRDDREDDSGSVVVRERRYGAFRRAFWLPEGMTADDVAATYGKGLLSVRVKGANAVGEGLRKVEIQATEPAALEATDADRSSRATNTQLASLHGSGAGVMSVGQDVGMAHRTVDDPEHHKRQVRRFYDDIWNRVDLAAIPDVLAPDVTFRGSLGPELTGPEEFAGYVREVTAALGDYRCEIESLVAEADRVAARMTFSGVHRGRLLGVPATGRRVSWTGAAFFTFSDGRIADLWVLGDLDSLRRQLT